jgi:hypothetical protein
VQVRNLQSSLNAGISAHNTLRLEPSLDVAYAVQEPLARLITGVQGLNPQRKQEFMSEQLGFLFLVLFVLAAAACIYLSSTMSRRGESGAGVMLPLRKQTNYTTDPVKFQLTNSAKQRPGHTPLPTLLAPAAPANARHRAAT